MPVIEAVKPAGRIAAIAGVVTVFGASLVAPEHAGLLNAALALIGVLIGIVNVTKEEASTFLLCGLALAGASTLPGTLAAIPLVGEIVNRILTSTAVLVLPAVLVVALRSVVEILKD